VAYVVLATTWAVAGRGPAGVKCVILREEEVLLVRHTYGPRRWELPGGTKRPWEEPAATARREAREEVGADIEDWTTVRLMITKIGRARVRLHTFSTRVEGLEPEVDGVEIAEARFFPVAALPDPRGRDVERIVALAVQQSGSG
jgi:8-oxo-dGTP pyrophosphatase MutT (NUDIX family)